MKYFLKSLLFAIISFLFSFTCNSQQVHFEFDHLSSIDGLSQNNVLVTFQDSKGFIWIGTEDGLNLYDGYQCHIYRNDPNNLKSIGSNFVRALVEDNKSNLWIGTQDGLNYYDRQKDNFVRYYHEADNPNTIVTDGIQNLFMDSRGLLWITSELGISLFDPKSGNMKLMQHDPSNPNSLPGNILRNVTEDAQGRIWIASFSGLSMYNPVNQSFTNFIHNPDDPGSISSNKVQYVFVDSKNRVWAGTFDNGLNLLIDFDKGKFKRFVTDNTSNKSLPHNLVNCIAQNARGVVWVGTSGGLCYFDEFSESFIRILSAEDDEKGLSSPDISHIYFDNTDRMWIGTRFGGINIYDEGKSKFSHYKNIKTDPFSLRGENITSFAEDAKGNIWVGSDGGGLNYLDRQTGKFTHIFANANYPGGLTNNKVLALCLDSYGLLWIGMWDGGINVYDPVAKTFRHYINDPSDSTSLCGNNIFYIIEDSQKDIWIATWGGDGICKYNREKDNFQVFRNNPNDSTTISASGAVMMLEDHEGNLWIPSEGAGLNKYERNKGIFRHYGVISDPKHKNKGLSNLAVYCVYEDSKKRLWIGTNGGGLNLLDRKTETFTYYRMADGLPNDVIYGILEDRDGNLWISTNNGLCRFNPDSLTYKNFDVTDGLQNNQFSRWAFKKLSTGEMLFGGVNGFNLFDPLKVKENRYIPPVYITGLKLFNKKVNIGEKSVLKQNIIVTKEIILTHKQNVFSFEFVALNYRQSTKNQYKYKMEGFNDDWIDLGSQREASFTNLNPGKYVFRVKASNNDGIWNEDGASLRLIIRPPWYGTWIFRILLALLLSGIAYYIYKSRTQKEKEIKKYLENKVKEGEIELQKKMDEIEMHQKALREKENTEKELNWFNEGMAKLGEIINKNNNDFLKLGKNLVPALIEYTGASLGALYIISSSDDMQSEFKLAGSFGVNPDKIKSNLHLQEGYIGACFKEKTIIAIDNLPDNYSVLESGLGKVSLKHLLLVPLLLNNQVNGIIELSSLEKLEPYKIKFLEKLAESLASTIEIINVSNRMQKLVEKMHAHSEEMNAQHEELQQNIEEMQATQEEIERIRLKEKELVARNEELIKHQEAYKELEKKYNELLEKYNQLLKKKKAK
jgi:ligand-binding sensor domain-containing protein